MIAPHLEIKEYHVGLYCRLSVDDGNQMMESTSISNQKEMLLNYAKDKGWKIVDVYIDDGYSGTNFDRPGFKEMVHDIEMNRINTVITKDLSRLGRDYLKTGYYIDTFFPDHNVRYIAISDNIDTFQNEDDFLSFKNIINEMYAKDVSKKIRFTIQNQIKVGKNLRTAVPLYGYMYNEKNDRVPDPVTAPVVQKIFKLFLSGLNYASIAKRLEQEQVLTPMYYFYQKYGYGEMGSSNHFTRGFYHWSRESVRKIIINDEYTGNFRRGKSQSRFKSKKIILIPKEGQHVFPNRYPPLINQKDFDMANQQVDLYRENCVKPTINRYSGLVFCGVCGKPMRHKADRRVNQRDYIRITCRTVGCSDERGTILYEDLDKVIKKELMSLKKAITNQKDKFLQMAIEASRKCLATSESEMLQNEKKMCKENITKLERYIRKAHEQKVDGILPDDAYHSMMAKYVAEKDDLESRILFLDRRLEAEQDVVPDYVGGAKDFIEYLDSLNLVNCLQKVNLNLLISKIIITNHGNSKYRERMDKKVVIVYKKIDALIKEFMQDEE
jgi:DNA invertase Pin-like site-specific DNA recombinase